MVLARRIGTRRPYLLVLLLYVGTFGLYGIYWHYRAHHEVYRQFELDLEQRQEGFVWILLDRAFFPLRWIYQHGFVGNVVHVRRRMALDDGIRPAGFLALTIPGSTAAYASFILLVTAMGVASALPWLIAAGTAFVVGAALQIPAYARLQSGLNQLWDAFDERMERLIPSRPEAWTPVPPASSAPPTGPPPS